MRNLGRFFANYPGRMPNDERLQLPVADIPSQVRKVDTNLIDQIIKKAKAIENADFDLLSQSQRMKKLSRQYDKLKNQLLARMKNESNVPCKTT